MTPKSGEKGLEEILRRDELIGDERGQRASIQLVEDGAAERRLSQPAAPVITTSPSRRLIAPSIATPVVMRRAVIEEPRIGRQAERPLMEAVERLVCGRALSLR